jgi:hypothetical protein
MKYSVRELQNENEFTLLHVLSLEDIVRFVFRQMRNRNLATVIFYAATLCSFVWMVLSFFYTLLPGQWGWAKITLHCFYGFILWPVILIPVHELIHAVVYKMAGAPNIKFGIKPESYLFYVTADKYVIGRKPFMIVAFTPFLIVGVILLLFIVSTTYPLSWSLIACLFVHTTMCIGDLAIAGFFMAHHSKEIYTYDDTEKEETYFYVKKNVKLDVYKSDRQGSGGNL